MFIDTHAHLTSLQLHDKIDEMLKRAQLHRIAKIVNICTDEQSLKKGCLLSEKEPWVYNTAATTPHDVASEGDSFFPLVEEHARKKKLVALGETGLDYYYEHSPRDIQKQYLERYCALAVAVDLPLIFHCRNAFSDLFTMADHHYANKPAILHCFTGTLGEAKEVLDRGWLISISGIATFKKSEELRKIIHYVPIDRLLIETDAPYLAPQSRRGQINEPSFLIETAELIASLKGLKLEAVGEMTARNAEQFFSFSKVH